MYLTCTVKSPPFGGLGGSNGEQEFRKRAKLPTGDLIEVFEFQIRIE